MLKHEFMVGVGHSIHSIIQIVAFLTQDYVKIVQCCPFQCVVECKMILFIAFLRDRTIKIIPLQYRLRNVYWYLLVFIVCKKIPKFSNLNFVVCKSDSPMKKSRLKSLLIVMTSHCEVVIQILRALKYSHLLKLTSRVEFISP